ncbi:MAG: hypothetical protein ACYDEY_04015 [Acidimicrobiales bacterium]
MATSVVPFGGDVSPAPKVTASVPPGATATFLTVPLPTARFQVREEEPFFRQEERHGGAVGLARDHPDPPFRIARDGEHRRDSGGQREGYVSRDDGWDGRERLTSLDLGIDMVLGRERLR